MVPHELIVGELRLRDGIDITPDEFYRRLQEESFSVTTSAPNPETFLEAFEAAGEVALDVLCITLTAQLSGAYNSACIARDMVSSRLAEIQVKVVDAQAAAGATGLIALAAARASSQGQGIEAVSRVVEKLIPRVHLLAFVDTLYYLERSGRVNRVQSLAASIIGIKPMFELKGGQPRLVAKPRSRARALQLLAEHVRARDSGGPMYVNVMEANAPIEAASLAHSIESQLQCRDIFVSQFTPVMGAHTGPGLVGVAFYSEE